MNGPSEKTLNGARCNACGEAVRPGEPFCTKCGEPVACRNCGQLLQSGDRYCPSCGTSKTKAFASGEATLMSSPWDLVLAKLRRATLGEFDIKGEIGRGGMAAVYLAHEVALDRRVAIKVMSPSLLMGQGMAQRFRQEAVTVANLNHQHIITIHAVRQFEDLQYFVMQFVEGCSLETIITQADPLPIPAVRAMLYHVGSALAHAHAQGVIHRDIKPGNILVDRTGQALVTDFGIAKVMESPSNTQTGMVVGTPAYMSPEQCQSGQITWRSDQYALGIVGYEMVAGAAPFDGTTLSVIHSQVHDPVPHLLEQRADCPAELALAIHRMLAKDPDERFTTLAEALQALGAMPLLPGDTTFQQIAWLVGTHRSQASVPTTPVSPLMRRTADGEATVVSAERNSEATTTPIPAMVHGSAATRPVAKHSPTVTASPAPRRVRRWPWVALLAVIAGGSGAGWYAQQRAPAVDTPPVAGVALLPEATTLTVGDTAQLAATAIDSTGATVAGHLVEWHSADSTIVTVTGRGRISAAGLGATFVLAQSGPHIDSTLVTVTGQRDAVASITIAQPRESLRPGKRTVLRAIVAGTSGARLGGRAVRWSSSNTAIVRVDSVTGEVRALKPGRVDINASVEGRATTLALTVGATKVARVRVNPTRLTLARDSTATIQARVEDDGGRQLTGRAARWTSADESIAAVTSGGAVTAVAPGSTTIRVSVNGKTASVPVTVSVEPMIAAALAISDYVEVMAVGDRHDLAVSITDTRGRPMSGTVSWASGNGTVVKIDSAGRATAQTPGTAWLVAETGALRDSVSVTVAVPAVDQVRQGVQTFLSALSARDADRLEPMLSAGDEGQQELAGKLLDKVRGGQWDLEIDTLPRGYTTRIESNRAEATFTAELAWKNAFGGRKRQEVQFVALFTRDGARWTLAGVRLGDGTKL